MQDEKLIEEMEKAYRSQETRHGYYCGKPDLICKELLSVIRQNISMVAEVCPECGGFGEVCVGIKGDIGNSLIPVEDMQECPDCKGHGIIAKQERV